MMPVYLDANGNPTANPQAAPPPGGVHLDENGNPITGGVADAGTAKRTGATGGWDAPPSVGEFAGNVLSSGVKIAKDLGTAITHPVEAVKAIGRVAVGGVQNQAEMLGASSPTSRGLEDFTPEYNAFKSSMVNRYGGWSNIKKTAYEDPVGLLLDASALFTGGGAAAESAGLTTTAKVLRTAGEVTDPLRIAGKVVKPILKPLGEAGAVVLGKMTGVGAENIKTAAAGADEFANKLRGSAGHEEIANDVVKAAENVAEQRRVAYQAKLAATPMTTGVPMAPVEGALRGALKKFNIGIAYSTNGQGVTRQVLDFSNSAIDAASEGKISSAFDDVMKRAGGSLTASDMDILKQRLSNLVDLKNPSRADAVVNQVLDRTKSLLNAQVPGYKELTSSYHEASDFLREVKSEMATKGAKGTQVRKIAAAYNQRNTYRGDLLDELGAKTGKDFKSGAAGADMSNWAPRGLAGVGLGAVGMYGATHVGTVLAHPTALVALAATSPRLMGEILYNFAKLRKSKALAVATNPVTVRAASASGAQMNDGEDPNK